MTVNAVAVGVSILEVVAVHGPIGVSEISRMTGTPKATAQRMLTTWHKLGWIEKEESRQIAWSLTSRLTELGSHHNPVAHLKRTARPEMERLSEKLGGETIHLAIRSADAVKLVDRVEGTKPVRTHYPIGGTTPLHATASGHAHLSLLTDEEIERLFAAISLVPVTPHTITDITDLLKTLRKGRSLGYFKVERTNHSETSAIASPITYADGSTAGAISISLPSARLDAALARTYGEAVAKTAATITKRFALNSTGTE